MKRKWTVYLFWALGFLGTGTFLLNLFAFRGNPAGGLMSSFLTMVGIILILLYIRLFIVIVKDYALNTTLDIYNSIRGLSSRMDLRLFRFICLLILISLILLVIWLAKSVI